MQNLLLLIDPQNDFADPKGSLYVPGAFDAILEICRFIKDEADNISDILISQDTHQKFNIGFSDFWEGDFKPFDKIKTQEILDGKIKPVSLRREISVSFRSQFQDKEEITLWPYHCLEGSWGWCFPEPLIESLNDWVLHKPKHRTYEVYRKGYIPEIESYSVLSDCKYGAEYPYLLLNSLYDKIYVAGFCKDICVAESLKDMRKDDLYRNKLVILDNCMATIDPNSPNLEIYKDLVENFGAKIENP